MTTRNILVSAFIALNTNAIAQAQQTNAPAGFRITAARQVIRPNGMRLEGNTAQPARIQSPQIDVSALVLAFDYAGNSISQVRAQNSVSFKLNLADQVVNGKAQPVRIEARTDNAVLDAVPKNGRRTLTLKGNVKGFYEVGDTRNNLNGQSAVITFGSGLERALDVQIEGGTDGVRLEVDGGAFGADVPLETLVVTAARASIDQKTNIARLTGNARAVSNSRAEKGQAAQKLEVSAPEFEMKLGERGANTSANGATALSGLQSLQTRGRTKIVVDMPPAPVVANAASAVNARSGLSPTHLEVSADSATVEPGTQRIVLLGNVSGFYTVPTSEEAKAQARQNNQSVSESTRYQFSGDRATARFVGVAAATEAAPAGLNLEVVGAPVSIDVPGFNLGLD